MEIYLIIVKNFKKRLISMKKIIILFMVLAFAMPTFAVTWVQVGKNEFIDIDSIKTYTDDKGNIQKDKKIYWMKQINNNGSHKSFEKLFKRKISHSLNMGIIDIDDKLNTFKAYMFYDEKGTFIYDYSEKDEKLRWTTITPNSNAEFWYKIVTEEKLQEALRKTNKQ